MLKDIIKDKPKIHTRNISLATYPHNKTEIIEFPGSSGTDTGIVKISNGWSGVIRSVSAS